MKTCEHHLSAAQGVAVVVLAITTAVKLWLRVMREQSTDWL